MQSFTIIVTLIPTIGNTSVSPALALSPGDAALIILYKVGYALMKREAQIIKIQLLYLEVDYLFLAEAISSLQVRF